MSSRTSQRARRRLAAGLCCFALVVAACGGDEETDTAESAAPEATETAEATEPATTEAAPDATEPATTDAAPDATDPATTDGAPVAADGEPIKIGVQNLEGDPNGSFPEYSLAIQAAADYVNAELGGLGGRPIEIVLCKSVVSPDDSQRCANELAAEGVEMAISTINFFGNHFSIYQGSNIPVLVGTPITIGDFTSPGVYSIGAGGGCLGVHTGLVQFATQELPEITGNPVSKVSVPWADTPPGVVCYYDLEAKPLDVLNGATEGAAELAGSMPDLTHIGVPVAPATPDITPQATEVLDFDPDVIIFSAQGADCWNFVDGLGRLGWTPEQVPLVLSGSCIDFTAMAAAGDLAKGIYITGTENAVLSPLDQIEGLHLEYATTYQTKGLEYGLTEDDLFKGFAGQGFSAIMNIWEQAQTIDGDVTGEAISAAFAATDGSQPAFGGSPLDCAGAPEPYVAVCSSSVSITQWDGTQLVPVIPALSGLDLVAGTELKPGP
jgi:branched-chain amino acid transport system substrate-binding protein